MEEDVALELNERACLFIMLGLIYIFTFYAIVVVYHGR